jgi:hypothetical protein
MGKSIVLRGWRGGQMSCFSVEQGIKTKILQFLLFRYISSFVPGKGFFSHAQGSITWPMKRTVPVGGGIMGVENRKLDVCG